MIKFKFTLLSCLVLCTIFAIGGCGSSDSEVKAGEAKKIYSPSGIYSEVFVDPEQPSQTLITSSSDASGSMQIRAYFDDLNLRRILLQNDSGGLILILKDQKFDHQNLLLKIANESESGLIETEYILIPVDK